MYLLQDIIYHAYKRAVEVGAAKALPGADYEQLFEVTTTDITKTDNSSFAIAANNLSQAFNFLAQQINTLKAPTLWRQVINLLFRTAGDALTEDIMNQIMDEIGNQPPSIQPLPPGGTN